MKQRRKQLGEQMIVDGFQPHNYYIALRHVSRMLVHIYMVEMEGTIAGIDLHATLFHKLIITMRQEMHLLSAICQLAAIKASYGSCTYYSVSHQSFDFSAKVQGIIEIAKSFSRYLRKYWHFPYDFPIVPKVGTINSQRGNKIFPPWELLESDQFADDESTLLIKST
jgi:hypothetical protein